MSYYKERLLTKYYFGALMGINFVENNKKMTDNEVILLINGGEYEYLQIIIDRYLPLIVKTARNYCPQNEVEDAVQEATFALYSAVKNYDPQKSVFSAFAAVCIKRSVIAHLRKNNLQRKIPEELLLSIEQADISTNENPESLFIEKESYESLTDSIKLELSNMEYSVLQLFLDGKTYGEIAKQLNITEKSVDNALSRIRKKIKNNG